ncbi:glutamate racemase [Teredinibacter waterburyi]|jgi:glutamate racemase|uniref:glutamate racemase n=1 Tax=Teredinibacter waterburyi TaxID=1500538 RepID=UPI00165F1D44|nr:glutamate racemase [Teredinibacter waterburyi]
MSTRANILVFDSGAGGLTVTREILLSNTYADITYVADNALFPYGILEDAQLSTRIITLMGVLLAQHQPDIVVIACNTASTIVLETLRKCFDTIFVGVVPAIKPAAAITQTGVIGLLATPATIDRAYTANLIREFAKEHTILRHGSGLLVRYAEDLLANSPIDETLLTRELRYLTEQKNGKNIDTIILACTHFPILQDRLHLLPEFSHINWVDSGNAIARRVSFHLANLGKSCSQHGNIDAPLKLEFIYTLASTSPATQHNYQRYLSTYLLPGTEVTHQTVTV